MLNQISNLISVMWHSLTADNINTVLYSGKPVYGGIIVINTMTNLVLIAQYLQMCLQAYLIMTINSRKRYMIMHVVAFLPEVLSFFCFYSHWKNKSKKTRKRLPLASFINVMISAFIMILCAFTGVKKNHFAIAGK